MDKNEPYELFSEIMSHLKTLLFDFNKMRIAALTFRFVKTQF